MRSVSNNATMTKQSTLAAGGLEEIDDLQVLVDAVRPSDTLLAVGPVTARLARRSAEPDFLLIGAGASVTAVAACVATADIASYRLPSGRAVKVKFCVDQELRSLSALVDRCESALSEPAMLGALSDLRIRAGDLLHELGSGVVLANPSIARAWREELHTDRLHLYLAAGYLTSFSARRGEIAAYLEDGDEEAAQWVLREAMGDVLAAVLAGFGQTTMQRQWHLQLLRRFSAELCPDKAARLMSYLSGWSPGLVVPPVAEALAFAVDLTTFVVRQCPELAPFA
jgi:hypothetical protein